MSGPITVGFSFGPLGAVVLAALALREAAAMGEEYTAALEQVKEREARLAVARSQQRENRLEQQAALLRKVDHGERQLERLKNICATLCASAPELSPALTTTPLERPAASDQGTLTAHAHAVQQEIGRIEALLAQISTRFDGQLRASLDLALNKSPRTDLDELLNAYALQRSLQPGLDPARADELRQTVARVLGRLELPAGATTPQELEALASAIMLAPSSERAEELASELRLGVQRFREEQGALQQDAEEAKSLLEALPDDVPDSLRTRLELVASGSERFDPELRQALNDLLAASRKAQQRLEQEAAASVLEQSLRDLGFEVEGVESTLFVEGGMVHFQRPGWENYFVRLRLDPREQTLNFNVVRPRSDEDNAERRRLDTLAEDRWCSEFPRLMKTLEARGLLLKVTRQLGAGELPVQAVDPATLPQARSEEERSRTGAAPLHMKHP